MVSDDRSVADMTFGTISPELAARAEKVVKMWDKAAAVDLRAKAEDYLLEHKSEGFERSARVGRSDAP